MSSLQNRIIAIASVFGLLAIALGAMGAHFLKEVLTAEQLTHIETGARYQMYHAIVLFALAIAAGKMKKGFAQVAWILFTLGIICFSFSLYAITAFEVLEIQLPKIVFLITPIGGLLLMGGWLTLFIYAMRSLYLRNSEKRKNS